MPEFFWGDDSCWEIPNSANELGKKMVVEVEAKAANTTNKCPAPRHTEELGQAGHLADGPSPAMVSKKRSKKNADAAGPSTAEHDLHILTERERRLKMRSMFSNLHALLPHLPPKADKSTIVEEAITYIKKSEEVLEKLKKQKEERRVHLQGSAIISCYGAGSPSFNKLLQPPAAMTCLYSREAFLADHHHQSSIRLNPRTNNYSPPAPATFKTCVSPNVVVNICGDNAHINICSVKKLRLLTTISFCLEKHSLEVVSVTVSSDQYHCMYMIHAQANKALQEFIAHGILSAEEKFQQAAAEIITFINSI